MLDDLGFYCTSDFSFSIYPPPQTWKVPCISVEPYGFSDSDNVGDVSFLPRVSPLFSTTILTLRRIRSSASSKLKASYTFLNSNFQFISIKLVKESLIYSSVNIFFCKSLLFLLSFTKSNYCGDSLSLFSSMTQYFLAILIAYY